MTRVQFGLVVPGDKLEKSRRHRYMEDVNRLLDAVKGHYDSAWFVDHCGGFPKLTTVNMLVDEVLPALNR